MAEVRKQAEPGAETLSAGSPVPAAAGEAATLPPAALRALIPPAGGEKATPP